jgi:hypothetical protein
MLTTVSALILRGYHLEFRDEFGEQIANPSSVDLHQRERRFRQARSPFEWPNGRPKTPVSSKFAFSLANGATPTGIEP